MKICRNTFLPEIPCKPPKLSTFFECPYNFAPQEYKHYFDNFLEAQNAQPPNSTADKLKKEYIQKWMANFQHFVQAPVAKDIAVVQEYRAKLLDIKNRGL